MLDKIRKLLGVKSLPEEVAPLYRDARDEREALVLLREARRRDEARRRRALGDLEELDRMEEELLEEGRRDMTDNRRLMIARRVKEIRWKMQELNHRIENIYNKRLRVLNEHVASLETVLELKAEPLPDRRTMEEMAIQAKQLLEELDKTRELAEGISTSPETARPDMEEKEILRELASAAAEAEAARREPPEPRKSRSAEKPSAEPRRERPDAMFEE
jgi:hypothetical protein